MKVIVTGAAGFVGSNIVLGLNRIGIDNVIAVDNLTRGDKFKNLVGTQISDYVDKTELIARLQRGDFGPIDAIFHEGACSDTMEHDGRYMLDNNYRVSKDLLDLCLARGIRLLYASSAATYGASAVFTEDPANERPLNVYGYSKLLFDEVVRRHLRDDARAAATQLAGFRYFNVYGPREQHKGRMASVAFHHVQQFRDTGSVKLFGEHAGYAPGCQSRDFVSVDDVVAVNLWFLEHPQASGIVNLGSGRSQPFNDVAHAVVNTCRALDGQPPLPLAEQVAQGLIQYVPFPEALVGKYQSFTQADLTALRATGCDVAFADVATGVERYVRWLAAQ